MKEYPNLHEELTLDTVEEQGATYLINTARMGIQFPEFMNIFSKCPFSMQEWSRFLHLSERSFQRYKKEKKTFDSIHSEKILEVALLYKRGLDVFGSKEKFDQWLASTNVALGNAKPKDFLDNTFGINLLKEELNRIAYGVLA